jgi:cytosine/adenosine deaminase-related metal-dependent hydrolase
VQPIKNTAYRAPNTAKWLAQERKHAWVTGVGCHGSWRFDETPADHQHARIQAERYADWMARNGRTHASVYAGASAISVAGVATRYLARYCGDLRPWLPDVTFEELACE